MSSCHSLHTPTLLVCPLPLSAYSLLSSLTPYVSLDTLFSSTHPLISYSSSYTHTVISPFGTHSSHIQLVLLPFPSALTPSLLSPFLHPLFFLSLTHPLPTSIARQPFHNFPPATIPYPSLLSLSVSFLLPFLCIPHFLPLDCSPTQSAFTYVKAVVFPSLPLFTHHPFLLFSLFCRSTPFVSSVFSSSSFYLLLSSPFLPFLSLSFPSTVRFHQSLFISRILPCFLSLGQPLSQFPCMFSFLCSFS